LPDHEAWARGVRHFDLDELLDALRSWAQPLTWRIDDLWALAGFGQVFLGHRGLARELELDHTVLDPACGDVAGPLSFAQLVAFAACTHQVVDGLFVGTDGGEAVGLPELGSHVEYLRPDATWFRACPVVIHAFDSTYWRVFVRDEAAAAELTARFPHAVRLE
jgi:hypothetical protein